MVIVREATKDQTDADGPQEEQRRQVMPRLVDIRKAIEAIVYVSHKNGDLFHVVKILYYADKFHLAGYGRLITGDYYVAMKDGPVPSAAYDIIKAVRGDGLANFKENPQEAFRVDDWMTIVPNREPNLDYLSESDVEALDKAIGKYSPMSFQELWDAVHEEEPYKQARSDISLESIIKSLSNGDEVLAYMNS
jgi:uncharacterized phage-associated protein